MDYIERKSKSYGFALLALFLGSFVTFSDLYCLQPLIPVFSEQFHLQPAVGSLALSVSTVTLAACLLIASAVSDVIGRKRLMVFSLFFSALLTLGVSVTSDFSTLLVLRLLEGIAISGFPAVAMGYINEEFDPKLAGFVMGIYVSGTSVGGMAGRFLVGALTDFFNWHIAVAVLGGLSLLVSLLFWRLLPEPTHVVTGRQTLRQLFRSMLYNLQDPGLVLLYGIGFALMGSFVTVYNYIGYPLMAAPYNLSQAVVGMLFTVYLMGTFSSAWMGKLAQQRGRSKVMSFGIVIMLSGGVITLAPQLAVKIIGLAIFTFGFFGSHAIASSWVGKRTDRYKAQASSLYLLFYYVGSSVMGATGGVFWSHQGWIGVISLTVIMLLLALGGAISVPFIKNRRNQEVSSY